MTGKMVDRIRRDGSFEAAGTSEDTLQLYRYLDTKQAILRAVLDEVWDDGEGELTAEQEGVLATELHAGKYQWVRIYKDETYKKAIATFYLWTVDGVLERMWLARGRKQMSPNPLDEIAKSSFIPSLAEEQEGDIPLPHEKSVVDTSSLIKDHRGSQGIKGVKPTLLVKCIRYEDHNHVWEFPNFRVQSTILAPVLLKLRSQGRKQVDLRLLQKAIQVQREQR